MTICIIPARLGSKSIKNKNIKFLKGKHLIGHVIKIAKSSGLFKRIIVSTDSYKISRIAKKYGAEVPFLRSKKLANDFAPTKDVILDCINKISSENSKYLLKVSLFMANKSYLINICKRGIIAI